MEKWTVALFLQKLKFNNQEKYYPIKVYLDMSLFGLPILHVLPKVVADGSEGGMHLHTKVAPVPYRSFIYKAFL